MASRSNPNVPSKQRRTASRAKVQRRKSVNKVTKNPRGTAKSNVLCPTSGPAAPLSGKKAKKLERAQNHARRRAIELAMENEGEVEMIDPPTTKAKTENAANEKMELDDIS
ncbi:Uncharacterized protein BP5553_07355 [Venustampulla echinocandica]|uniref:Ribosome biogenesis protein ALB1 n=1 Tax=Venustampulla echinocandica TaxID=2656787 RepID=A0A370TJ86_9HELO|nr:Uncharacterized protein BP5553_07355 [Venustampulla echinocandica]RDL35424.1 Uncharacterized protein BP5553_07355 [Venustampulla echinocandica]